MLETVEAVRFIKSLNSGRNRPWLIEAERSNGEIVEVVAKLATSECGPGGLVREAFCSMLAADLDLPVSEPFVVNLSKEFIDELGNDEQKRCAGISSCFGCLFVPNMFSVNLESTFPASSSIEAAHTLAFDAGVLNPDRKPSKPNCLTDGNSILLIDHELSLNLHGRGFFVHDPWTDTRLNLSNHLFYTYVKDNQVSHSEFFKKLKNIPKSRITQYKNAIPPIWDKDNISPEIEKFLFDLIENSGELELRIKEATS